MNPTPLSKREKVYDEIESLQLFSSFVRQFISQPDISSVLLTKIYHLYCIIQAEGGFERIFTFDLWNKLSEEYASVVETFDSSLFDFTCEHLLSFLIAQHYNWDALAHRPFSQFVVKPIFDQKTHSCFFGQKESDKFIAILFKFALNTTESNLVQIDQQKLQKGKTKPEKISQNNFYSSGLMDEIEEALSFCSEFNLPFQHSPSAPIQEEFIAPELYLKYSKQIPKEFCFASCYDGLSKLTVEEMKYMVPRIETISYPVKLAGREEQLGLASVRINLGPARVEWMCVERSDVNKLRELILKSAKIDIFKQGNKFFDDFYFCLANKVSVAKFVQYPGQAVITNSGTFFWQNIDGPSTIVHWNFLSQEKYNIEDLCNKSVQSECLLQFSPFETYGLLSRIQQKRSSHCSDEAFQ